jgi:hypothetical protein
MAAFPSGRFPFLASPLRSRLANASGRIEFIIVLFMDWSFASSCSPPVSRRRSCLRLRTDQCFCPIGTFTLLLVRTFRRTSIARSGQRIQTGPMVLIFAPFPFVPSTAFSIWPSPFYRPTSEECKAGRFAYFALSASRSASLASRIRPSPAVRGARLAVSIRRTLTAVVRNELAIVIVVVIVLAVFRLQGTARSV